MTPTAGTTKAPPLDDAELLRRIRAGEREAFETLFARYYRRVFAFVSRRMNDDSLSEEIVVDTFFEVWRSASSFRGESRPSTWLFGIAHFKIRSALRSRSRAKRSRVIPVLGERLAEAPDPLDSEKQLVARDELARLKGVLDSLSVSQRRAAELVWLEGMSQREAAQQLGVTTDTLKARLWRVRNRVRAELRPGAEMPPSAAGEPQ